MLFEQPKQTTMRGTLSRHALTSKETGGTVGSLKWKLVRAAWSGGKTFDEPRARQAGVRGHSGPLGFARLDSRCNRAQVVLVEVRAESGPRSGKRAEAAATTSGQQGTRSAVWLR
jgi:hypothetical protein